MQHRHRRRATPAVRQVSPAATADRAGHRRESLRRLRRGRADSLRPSGVHLEWRLAVLRPASSPFSGGAARPAENADRLAGHLSYGRGSYEHYLHKEISELGRPTIRPPPRSAASPPTSRPHVAHLGGLNMDRARRRGRPAAGSGSVCLWLDYYSRPDPAPSSSRKLARIPADAETGVEFPTAAPSSRAGRPVHRASASRARPTTPLAAVQELKRKGGARPQHRQHGQLRPSPARRDGGVAPPRRRGPPSLPPKSLHLDGGLPAPCWPLPPRPRSRDHHPPPTAAASARAYALPEPDQGDPERGRAHIRSPGPASAPPRPA